MSARNPLHSMNEYPQSDIDHRMLALVDDYDRGNVSATAARRLLRRASEFVERVREVTKV